ncbi:hypothetical protein ABPG75_011421 [Micractinium tetrahymenae]
MAAAAPERVAVVTGGTRGIGRGIADCLARDGYSLVLGYNSDAATAEAAAAELRAAHGVQVHTVGGDLTLPTTADALFEAVTSHFGGRCTALVHNAGLYIGVTSVLDAQPAPMGSADDDWEAHWAYYHATYVMAFKRLLERAQRCEGLRHVVATSAQGCNASWGPSLAYEAPGQAEAGLEYLVRFHALRLAAQGVNVNAIVSGFIKTLAWDKLSAPEEVKERLVAAMPAQRWGQPHEIGELAAFLCSDRAAFLTGAGIPVDGGLHLRN